MRTRRQAVPSTTSAALPASEQSQKRLRTYVWLMIIRTVFFGLTIFIYPWGWYTIIFAAGAVLIPYFAVVIANASGEPAGTAPDVPVLQLPQPPTAPTDQQVLRISESPQKPDQTSSEESEIS